MVPVPKTPHPREPNHFRPVALTSNLMKPLERMVLGHLGPGEPKPGSPCSIPLHTNPTLGWMMLQRCPSHLEDTGNTVRIPFFDFSSAFNTVHPSLERAGARERGPESRGQRAWARE